MGYALPDWYGTLNQTLWNTWNDINFMMSSAVLVIADMLHEATRKIVDLLNLAFRMIAEAINEVIHGEAVNITEEISTIAWENYNMVILLGSVTIPDINATVRGVTAWSSTIVNRIQSVVNWVIENARKIYTKLSGYVHSIYDAIQKVLDAIHFKTILKVHKILMIVSPQYRAMMKKIYNALARVSEALGLGPAFLLLALQNVRNLVLDVSSMFGKRYDLAELTWMATLNQYLHVFTGKMNEYKNNPEAIFYDLAELIERPQQDAKGAFQSQMIIGLDTALEFADKVSDGLLKIGVDVDKLYDDLPQFVKDQIPDPGPLFTDAMTTFISTHVSPTIGALQTEVDAWQAEMEAAKGRVSALVERLRKPGDLVKGVDDLPTYERLEQEAILSEVTNRRLAALLGIVQPQINEAKEALAAAVQIPIPPPVTPPLLTYEPMGLTPAVVGPMTPRQTWFVGDY